ncbi:kinetochore-associated Ndc80 complex subunit nuf2 [Tulasnella sp. 419]|nr:kinetochore-associated Ndc80 complex subunit nuf2 [Tulasnella sp. 418]KAG8959434.1 kinetochore-associated Ndc80 complex subunit nuf2 [Tulasnella sp. 419]
MADELSIPIMKAHEVVRMLSDWGLVFTVDEINKPSMHTVQVIYDTLMFELINIRVEDLEVPREAITQDLEYEFIYDEGLKMQMFFLLIKKLLQGAAFEKFTFQDIARPDGLRLRKIISSVRNMLAFKLEREDFTNSMLQKMEDARRREVELDAEEEALRQEYEQLLQQRAEEDAQIPEAKQRNQAARKALNQEHKNFEHVKKEVETTKKEAVAKRDRSTVLSSELQSAKQRNDRVASRIIQSPERLKRTIANLASTVEQERNTLEQNKAKARDFQVKLDQLAIIEQDFRLAEDLLLAISTEQERLEQCNRDLHDVRTHHNNRQIEYRELKTKAEQLERQLANAKEKLERVQRTSAEKREASMARLDILKEKWAVVIKARDGMLAEHDLLRKEMEGIESEMAEYIKTNEKVLNDLMSEYWALRHDLDNYMNTLTTKFGLEIDSRGGVALPAAAAAGTKKKKKSAKKVAAAA